MTWAWSLLAATALVACLMGASRAGAADGLREQVRLVFVPDGDTVHVLWRGRRESVRLLRINAPERTQPGHDAARTILKGLVDTGPLLLEFERPGIPERDRFGRLLGYLWAADRNCSVEIVRAGWSRFWTRYGEGRYAGDLRRAEDEARAAKRGLWAAARRPLP